MADAVAVAWPKVVVQAFGSSKLGGRRRTGEESSELRGSGGYALRGGAVKVAVRNHLVEDDGAGEGMGRAWALGNCSYQLGNKVGRFNCRRVNNTLPIQ